MYLVSVTLSGNDDATTFRGFFLQARRKDEFRDTTEAIGYFQNAPTETKLNTCHGTANVSVLLSVSLVLNSEHIL